MAKTVDVTDYADAARRIHGIHGSIAADVWPDGGTLKCCKCKRKETLTACQCAYALAHGWPMCCGLTMTLSSAKKETL